MYLLIQESGDRGISVNDIKTRCEGAKNSAALNKVLKKLEAKFLVKSLKSIQHKNKKVWMLLEIEPSVEVTGGLIG